MQVAPETWFTAYESKNLNQYADNKAILGLMSHLHPDGQTVMKTRSTLLPATEIARA